MINAIDNIPSEVVKVPLIINDIENGDEFECNLLTGFFGFVQEITTFNLKPEIGWAVEMVKRI